MTVPLIGWAPKSRAMTWGFSVNKYGAQQQTDQWQPDAGNGVRTNGTLITGNDPLDTSVAIGPIFVQNWIAHLISRFGNAANGGVAYYNLDNEPMLWDYTHRDVHPQPTSYDELRDRTYLYGAAIKAADPTAKTLGPVLWGWTAYFYSALDWAPGGAWWNNPQDRLAHGNAPFVEWYLQQMHAYEQTNGVRILDYLDLHYYPQADGVALNAAGDAATQARRLRSTRSLWDPTYTDESWIAELVQLIPRMKAWVNANYPDTKLAITEYNWGGHEHINGALAQADVLGIFGRHGVDLACLWDPPEFNEPAAFAFRMYRNYDGDGARFGDTAVDATSTNQNDVSIFAALRNDALTIIAINKSITQQSATLTLENFQPAGPAEQFRYSAADVSQIIELPSVAISDNALNLQLPASSITLLVVPRPVCAADIAPPGGDGTVGVPDLLAVINNWGPCLPPCPADISVDSTVGVPALLAIINAWGACSE